MNRKVSEGLKLAITRFFHQNVFFRTELRFHGDIQVLVDSISFTCSINEKFSKHGTDGTSQFASQPGLSVTRGPRTISESTNLTFDADDAAVDAAVSMIDDFDEAMLALGDGLSESRGIRAGLNLSNSSLISVDRFSTASERNQIISQPGINQVNVDSGGLHEKPWNSESVKLVQNERNISLKDLESLLSPDRVSVAPKPQIVFTTPENQLQSPLLNFPLQDLSKSVLLKDRSFPLSCSNITPSSNTSALLPMQTSLSSQSWQQILQFLITQSQNLDGSTLANLIENITLMFSKTHPSPALPAVNTSAASNLSESFIQELSNLLNTSQTAVDISDLYNPDFNYMVDNLPVPPNSPTRPESRLGPLIPSNEYLSGLDTYHVDDNEQDSAPAPVPTPGLRKRTESEVSAWHPQEIQTLETDHDDLGQLSLSKKIDEEHDLPEEKALSLQESIAEMLSGKDARMAGLQNDVWFGHGKAVIERKDDGRQQQDRTRHRHMSEHLEMIRHDEMLRHRHMSENVPNLFPRTQTQNLHQGTDACTNTILPQVQEENVRHRHASENLSFSHEGSTHPRIRHRSEHTLGFTCVNDEFTNVGQSSADLQTFQQMFVDQNRVHHSSGNTAFLPIGSSVDRVRPTSVNQPFSAMTKTTNPDRVRHISGGTSEMNTAMMTRSHHNSGETQTFENSQGLTLNTNGLLDNVMNQGGSQVLHVATEAMDIDGTNQISVSRDILQEISSDAVRMSQLTGGQDTEAFEQEVVSRSRHVSGEVSGYGPAETKCAERQRHLSGNIQEELSQFRDANLVGLVTGNVQEFTEFTGQPGCSAGNTIQGCQNDEIPVRLSDGQLMPQVDAEVSQILQGSALQPLIMKMDQSRSQGAESAPVFSPGDALKYRHASVTFSPVVAVVQENHQTPGTPQVLSSTQLEHMDVQHVPASETAENVPREVSRFDQMPNMAVFASQVLNPESTRMRHASETALVLSQARDEAGRVRHASEKVPSITRQPQSSAILPLAEIFQRGKGLNRVDSSKSSENTEQSYTHVGEEGNISGPHDPGHSNEIGEERTETEGVDIPLSHYRFKCPVCGERLLDTKAYNAHKKHGHNDMKCPVCNKKCRDLHKLAEHLRRHTKTAHLTCGVCGRGFVHASAYKLHVMKHNNDRPYLCEHCGKAYTSLGQLETHKRDHGDLTQFGNSCTVCGKTFKTKTKLKTHLVTHSDVRSWVCDFCGKCFKTKQTLVTHTKTHSDVRPYLCTICGRAFKQVEALSAHKKTHYDGKEQHQCKQCNKVFKSSYSLRDHERLAHTGNVFQCTACDMTFKTKSGIEHHIRNKHINVKKIWSCPICQGVFPQERYLKAHLKCEHGSPKKQQTKRQRRTQAPENASLFVKTLLQNDDKIANVIEVGQLTDPDLVKAVEVQSAEQVPQVIPVDIYGSSPQEILSNDLLGNLEGNVATDGTFVQYVVVGSNIDIESTGT